MRNIPVDFDVRKSLMNLRATEEVTYNDVLRDLLNLGPAKNHQEENPISGDAPFIAQGVKFSHGKKLRTIHKGSTYYSVVDDGSLVYENKRYSSPSLAAIAITGYNVNGWRFWEYYDPEINSWIKIDNLRNNS